MMIRSTCAFLAVLGAAPSLEAKPETQLIRAVRATAVSPDRSGHCRNPQWSRDGRALSYERVFLQDRKIELDILSDVFGQPRERKVEMPSTGGREGDARRAIARFGQGKSPPLAPGDVCREFTWGPKSDPDIFAHACNVAGGTYQLFWSEGARLTNGRAASGQPALSPVGWRLAFVSAAQGVEGLALIDDLMEGNQPRLLVRTSGRIDRLPVWSPSGRSLAFVGHADNSADLYVIRDVAQADTTLMQVTNWPHDELNPSWSPDGRRLAFYANRGKARGRRAGYDLYVIDVKKGARPVRVATDVVLNEKHGPAWTPDGRHIVFVKNLQRGKLVDPIRAVEVRADAEEVRLKTDTVSNQDPVVTSSGGRWWVGFTSLGYWNAKKLAWRKVFVFPLDNLQKK